MRGGIRQYSWIIDLVGILFCAYFLAKVTSVYVGKALEVPRSIAVFKASDVAPPPRKLVDVGEYSVVLERNIFDSSAGPAEKGQAEAEAGAVQEAAPATGEAVQTSLDIKVLGVLVVGDGRDSRSTATIAGGGGAAPAAAPKAGAPVVGKAAAAGGGGAQKVYAVGDEESFAPNTKLTRVTPARIEFLNNGRLEFAEVLSAQGIDIFGPPVRETVAAAPAPKPAEKEALVKPESPGKFTVDQKEIDAALSNMDQLYTDIRAVPNFSGGKVSGMKILSVKNGSLFAKLGLRRGDVLQKINGMELDVKRGFEIFSKLKEEKNLQLDLIRQGQPTTMEYEIR
jgi:type II secretion system protein C